VPYIPSTHGMSEAVAATGPYRFPATYTANTLIHTCSRPSACVDAKADSSLMTPRHTPGCGAVLTMPAKIGTACCTAISCVNASWLWRACRHQ